MDKTWMDKIVIDNLSERQKEVFLLYKKIGMTEKKVAEELGCTKQNISGVLNHIKDKETKAEKPKKDDKSKTPKTPKRTTVSEKYQQYKTADLSILTDWEKEILTMKMEGKTYKEIAEELKTTAPSVGVALSRARAKLENKLEYREKKKEWHRNFVNNHPEFKEHLKAYNREYYLKNRERILEKARKRRNDG